MSKRKAVVNDIIYELHNEDLDSSSEDENKDSKKTCKDSDYAPISVNDSLNELKEDDSIDVVDVESSDDAITIVSPLTLQQNGGKTSPSIPKEDNVLELSDIDKDKVDNNLSSDDTVVVFNEDIVIDSSQGSSANAIIGCEKRTPLVSVVFKNHQLAMNYKQKIKQFMLKLIKLHSKDNLTGDEDENDLILDIWPEDLVELQVLEENKEENNIFFVDTMPNDDYNVEIPTYKQTELVLSNEQKPELSTPVRQRRGLICFNCEGPHSLRDCPLPRNNSKISNNIKAMNLARVGRYHIEDEQKYGHLVPGRISGKLRHAMGLNRNQLPLYIYKMRMLGYPPGWLEEARISHSGINMFDSMGKAIQDPEHEDGEVCEPGSKDKFDIKKILDYPGFNVPASSRYTEEAHCFGLPPLSDQDSKLNMLQVLAPNAMMAYKRKKLSIFPSASPNTSVLGPAEMELEEDDEVAEFPSVPPLPDEAPPLPPPPPPPPPPEPVSEPDSGEILDDIPLPEDSLSVLDDDTASSGRDSPSLDDLERKKQLLLAALENKTPSKTDNSDSESISNKSITIVLNSPIDIKKTFADITNSPVDVTSTPTEVKTDDATNPPIDVTSNPAVIENSTSDNSDPTSNIASTSLLDTSENAVKTPNAKTGHVKTTSYGTPVMNIASSYEKLPSEDKFSKDICDVINFENLPDSTGKYQKISTLLKRVKTEVDRIQDS